MNVIRVEHDTYIELRLGGAIWWEQIENEKSASGSINDVVEVQYWPTRNDVHTIECKVTQIIRTANSNRYIYRLVKVNSENGTN